MSAKKKKEGEIRQKARTETKLGTKERNLEGGIEKKMERNAKKIEKDLQGKKKIK